MKTDIPGITHQIKEIIGETDENEHIKLKDVPPKGKDLIRQQLESDNLLMEKMLNEFLEKNGGVFAMENIYWNCDTISIGQFNIYLCHQLKMGILKRIFRRGIYFYFRPDMKE